MCIRGTDDKVLMRPVLHIRNPNIREKISWFKIIKIWGRDEPFNWHVPFSTILSYLFFYHLIAFYYLFAKIPPTEVPMQNSLPDPMTVHPIAGYDKEIYVKPTLKNPNIIVGDFTYADSEFESHVTHHYDFLGDKLIIGKFCQIAAGVEFVMNGANHQMNAVSTFPFSMLEGWNMKPPAKSDLPLKGDTVIGNDVWIGQNAVILPGVHIGDGAIVGANAVVGSNVEPYTVVAGNPAQFIRNRFDEELTALLLQWKWWDKPVVEINSLIPILTNPDLNFVKAKIKQYLANS